MKTHLLLSLLLTLIGTQAWGDHHCPPRSSLPPDQAEALEFLQSIEGDYNGKTCRLSLRVCHSVDQPNQNEASTFVGELLLEDHTTGSEFYLPIQFLPRENQKTQFSIENGRRLFHFEFRDYNPDPKTGSVEIFLFEAVKTHQLDRLEYVEFGLRRPHDRRVRWAVCRFS